MAPLHIDPPLLNSANPWCTTLPQLQDLYNSPNTGAITTRTSLLNGFPHDANHHQFAFFNPTTHKASTPNEDLAGDASTTASLNTLGYSPLPLSTYLSFIQTLNSSLSPDNPPPFKPIIISVTGTAADIPTIYHQITATQAQVKMKLAMEINLSCPNIPGKTPPAYDFAALETYLAALKPAIDVALVKAGGLPDDQRVCIGIKIPPYTYQEQFDGLLRVLRESVHMKPVYLGCPVDFITAVNTLGSSLLLEQQPEEEGRGETTGGKLKAVLGSVDGAGVGGMAGAPLHPLALGNVWTIRNMLDRCDEVRQITIIGTGGVEDAAGFQRMKSVGAGAIGVGTALGRKGVHVFNEILGA